MKQRRATIQHFVQGDAREIEPLWRASVGQRAPTAIVTSPPYGNLKDYGISNQIGYGQTYAEFLEDMDDVLKGLTKISAESTTLWLVVDTFRQADALSDVWSLQQVPGDLSRLAADYGWSARDVIVWQKDRTLPWSGRGRLRNSFEYILMFVRGSQCVYNVDQIREPVRPDGFWKKWPERHHPAGSVPTNVWSIPIPVQGSWRNDSSHVCPLPPELVRRLVLLSSNPGDAVLDPFAGSGTVLTVAAELGRDAFGVDLSSECILQYEAHRASTLLLLNQNVRNNVVPPQDVIQARRIKFGNILLKNLAEEGFRIPLAEVTNRSVSMELRADLNLTLVFEPGQKRPTSEALFACAQRGGLSKFGLDLMPRMISTATWVRSSQQDPLYEPRGRGFWRLRPAPSRAETVGRAIERGGPYVVCSHPPAAYVAGEA